MKIIRVSLLGMLAISSASLMAGAGPARTAGSGSAKPTSPTMSQRTGSAITRTAKAAGTGIIDAGNAAYDTVNNAYQGSTAQKLASSAYNAPSNAYKAVNRRAVAARTDTQATISGEPVYPLNGPVMKSNRTLANLPIRSLDSVLTGVRYLKNTAGNKLIAGQKTIMSFFSGRKPTDQEVMISKQVLAETVSTPGATPESVVMATHRALSQQIGAPENLASAPTLEPNAMNQLAIIPGKKGMLRDYFPTDSLTPNQRSVRQGQGEQLSINNINNITQSPLSVTDMNNLLNTAPQSRSISSTTQRPQTTNNVTESTSLIFPRKTTDIKTVDQQAVDRFSAFDDFDNTSITSAPTPPVMSQAPSIVNQSAISTALPAAKKAGETFRNKNARSSRSKSPTGTADLYSR